MNVFFCLFCKTARIVCVYTIFCITIATIFDLFKTTNINTMWHLVWWQKTWHLYSANSDSNHSQCTHLLLNKISRCKDQRCTTVFFLCSFVCVFMGTDSVFTHVAVSNATHKNACRKRSTSRYTCVMYCSNLRHWYCVLSPQELVCQWSL